MSTSTPCAIFSEILFISRKGTEGFKFSIGISSFIYKILKAVLIEFGYLEVKRLHNTDIVALLSKTEGQTCSHTLAFLQSKQIGATLTLTC